MAETGDPRTDLAAARAFTAEHVSNRRQLTITFGSPDYVKSWGKPRCACKLWDTFPDRQCDRVGKVTLADGTTWCGIHEPAAIARRRARREACEAAKAACEQAKRSAVA